MSPFSPFEQVGGASRTEAYGSRPSGSPVSEWDDRQHRPLERVVEHRGERGVPRGHRRREADVAAPLNDVRVPARVSDSEQDERHGQEQEDQRHRACRP